MDALMYWGVDVIENIQSKFQNQSGLMIFLSHVGDPRFAFTIYFPVAYILHRSVGTRVLWVAVVAEWLNAILKWLLHGERPYWWVNQPGVYPQGKVPPLQQVSITCETGPGSPSGHAMITSAVWYILVSDFLYYTQIKSTAVKLAFWCVYVTLVCCVSVSRLYIAAHFPHQVIAGVISGVALAHAFNSISTHELRPRHYASVAVCLSLVAVATYWFLQLAGVNPLWSVELATQWCAYREWIHLDTTLFYCFVRDVASLVGSGFGAWFLSNYMARKIKRSLLVTVAQVLCALVTSLAAEHYKPSHDNITLFYTAGFIKHCVTVFIIFAGIPFGFEVLSGNGSESIKL